MKRTKVRTRSKLGRPTKMTTEVQNKIIECIAIGMTRDRAADYVLIHRDTFYAFQANNPDFSDRVKQAEARFIARHLRVIHRAATMPETSEKRREKHGFVGKDKNRKFTVTERSTENTKKDAPAWMASMTILERTHPQEFGRVDRHLIHTSGPKQRLPEEYIAAINVALGVKGEFKPLDKRPRVAPMLPAPTSNNGNQNNGDLDSEDELPILP